MIQENEVIADIYECQHKTIVHAHYNQSLQWFCIIYSTSFNDQWAIHQDDCDIDYYELSDLTEDDADVSYII